MLAHKSSTNIALIFMNEESIIYTSLFQLYVLISQKHFSSYHKVIKVCLHLDISSKDREDVVKMKCTRTQRGGKRCVCVLLFKVTMSK